MRNLILAVLAAGAGAVTAPSAQALTVFNTIDQTILGQTGSEGFGAEILPGLFSHSFIFTTTGLNDITISVSAPGSHSGGPPIAFSQIDLDGLYVFSLDNSGGWLGATPISAGLHIIHVKGDAVTDSSTEYFGGVYLKPTAETSGAVPEPAAWALMLTGFGMAGATLRRRRAIVA